MLTSQTVTLAGLTYPSLAAYRTLFEICAAAALAGTLTALAIPLSSASAEDPAGTDTAGRRAPRRAEG